jgi:hypothetical protein
MRGEIAVAMATVIAVSACASAPRRPTNDYGVNACPPAAADALLSVDALQCWFSARHGRWRTLSQESHFDVLVMQVEAFDTRDAEEIARRFVERERTEFSEILIYVNPDSRTGPGRVRRVRWTPETGFETIDFSPG